MNRKEKDGLWITQAGETYTVGLTAQKQEELGDVTFVSLPKVEQKLVAETPFLEVEAEKAVNEFKSPLSGKVASINETAIVEPKVLNNADEKIAWILTLTDVLASDFEKL